MNSVKLSRRYWLCTVAGLAAVFALPLAAHAKTYPIKPIKIIVPFAPGGGNDVFARQLATQLGLQLGVQVIVDNRAGAGGTVGTDAAAKSAADGYTLLLGHTGTLAINPVLYPKLPYDARSSFVPVAPVASAALVLVVPAASPIRSFSDLLAGAKASPGKLTFASSGNGTGGHLAGELLEELANVRLLHVPYKGTAPALTDLLGGQVDLMFSVIPSALPHIDGGKLRAIAITSVNRSVRLPNVPTVAEGGIKGYESSLAYGLMAPKGTPDSVLKVLTAAVAKASETAALRDALKAEGAERLSGSAADFAALMQAESAKWGQVINKAGIKPE
ncbi:tripartite tricarboxylate transporter substrate binding protein [Cupriavidus basilensis]|uniref:Tripartite tricarboxylate transporter substrate binding protein n=1 Tax=Cupriavidus basilensis TaxID=68895 RepID=A0ABT6B4S4_9BURK|nr:tripartite tricarboxylate transporter substrate binding protein [Cupriavidus basilensis]MDF3839882.1 tripartite tricarboxylate transporter substrate binding protein [Cupriavidus basilensis]